MLKARIIPTMLWKQFGLVKGVGFDSWRRVGPVLPAIRVYNTREVDELILVDIVAHNTTDDPDYESISDFGKDCFVPFTVGGGITRIDQVQKLLRAGADKVSINTHAFSRPKLITEIASRHGVQCVVVSIDVRTVDDGSYRCFSHAGQKETPYHPIEWAREMEDRGAGEILLTSVERDGTMTGYDLRLVESVVNAVGIPVIASGGAGTYAHMVDAIKSAGASAVAAASIFHFTEQTPAGAKEALAAAGIPVRSRFAGEVTYRA